MFIFELVQTIFPIVLLWALRVFHLQKNTSPPRYRTWNDINVHAEALSEKITHRMCAPFYLVKKGLKMVEIQIEY
jgi:hypothetical protein